MSLKVNLGSGSKILPDFTNIDKLPLKGVDIVCDLEQGIPLKDNEVELLVTNHVLEHLSDTVLIMEEIYRVCQNEAKVIIKVPYYSSIGAFKDPTHKRFFNEETFFYFDPVERKKRNLPDYGFTCKFRVTQIHYLWTNSIYGFPFWRNFLRKHFLNIVRSIQVELTVIKT